MKVSLLIALIFITLLSACGASAFDTAEAAVDDATDILIAADDVIAARYQDEHRRHRDLTDGEYAEAMEPIDAVVDAVRVSMSSMLAVRAALQAWAESDDGSGPFLREVACWIHTVELLRQTAEHAGINIPIPEDAVTVLSASAVICPPDRRRPAPAPGFTVSPPASGAG